MRPDGQRQTFGKALRNAFAGVKYGVLHERNVRIDALFALIPLVLGFAFGITVGEWLALAICIGMVIAFELVNTSLESLCDLVSPDYHVLAGRAKDCSAGACLVASLCALCVGVIVFAPRILALMGF